MSDSLRPHGLYSPWNSPSQNTGVGSLSLLQGNLPNWGIEPRSPALQADSLPAEPPGKPKNTGVGSLSLSNRGLRFDWILYQLSYEGSPPQQNINKETLATCKRNYIPQSNGIYSRDVNWFNIRKSVKAHENIIQCIRTLWKYSISTHDKISQRISWTRYWASTKISQLTLSPQDGEHSKDACSPLLLNTVRWGKKTHTDWQEEISLSLLADDRDVLVDNPRESTKNSWNK